MRISLPSILGLALLFLSSVASSGEGYTQLDISGSHNSNIYLESVDEQLTSTSGEGSQANIGLSIDYEFLDRKDSDLKIFADLMSEQYEQSELNSRFVYIDIPYSYYLASYRIRLTPSYLHFSMSNENALRYRGLGMDITKNRVNNQLGFSYKYTDKSADSDEYEAYNGSATDAHIFYKKTFYNGYLLSRLGATKSQYTETLEGDLSNTRVYFSASYKFRYHRYSGKLYGKARQVEYVADPYSRAIRSDNNWRVAYTNTFKASRNLDMYFSSAYTSNTSSETSADISYDYTQWVHTLGVQLML